MRSRRSVSIAYAYADYNAFYSPDDSNKQNYDFAGAGTHDAADGAGRQLASNPFAGARIMSDADRNIESTIDEAAIWRGTQKLSQVLAIFRDRYSPNTRSAIIDAGDPADDDAQGRRADIGAIDLEGHDQDQLGKFGTPPSEQMPPIATPSGGTTGGTIDGAAGSKQNAMGGTAKSGTSGAAGADGTTRGAAGSDATMGGAGAEAKHGTLGCSCTIAGRGASPWRTLIVLGAAISALGARRRRRIHRDD